MNQVFILSGVSGSGKSTWARKKNLPICSTDLIIDEFAKKHGLNYTQAFNEIQSRHLFGTITEHFYQNMEKFVKNNLDFAIDRTNINFSVRSNLIQRIKQISPDLSIIVVYFDIPKDVILKRLQNRQNETGKKISDLNISKQFERLQFPKKEEGFDKLIVVRLKEKVK